MDWSNERYVRVYTRDTTTWKLMDWRGRTVLSLLIRKVDRAGVLDVGHDGVLGLAAVLELPLDIVEAGIDQLTTSRAGMPTVVDTGTAYVLPNFLEAQEAPASDPQRKRESRARRRDRSLAESRNLLVTDGRVPDGDRMGHETGRDEDGNRNEVTPIRSVPSRPEIPPARDPAVPSPAPPKAPIADHQSKPGPDERRAVRDEIRAELEAKRAEVARKLGTAVKPLLAFDQGIDTDLQGQISLATTWPALDLIATQASHAIAMAAAETASGEKSLEWFTGAIFSPKNFRRLASKTATSRAGPSSSTARASTGQPMIRPKPPDEETA